MKFVLILFMMFSSEAARSRGRVVCTAANEGCRQSDLSDDDLFPPMCGTGNFRVTSDFGLRPDPVFGGTGNHRGCDLAAARGTSVTAVDDGVVSEAVSQFRPGGARVGYGNVIQITHNGKGRGINGKTKQYVIKYGHLMKVFVKKGDSVLKGQVIGTVNSTGKSTGDHLHLEVLTCDGEAADEKATCSAQNPRHFFDLSDTSRRCTDLLREFGLRRAQIPDSPGVEH